MWILSALVRLGALTLASATTTSTPFTRIRSHIIRLDRCICICICQTHIRAPHKEVCTIALSVCERQESVFYNDNEIHNKSRFCFGAKVNFVVLCSATGEARRGGQWKLSCLLFCMCFCIRGSAFGGRRRQCSMRSAHFLVGKFDFRHSLTFTVAWRVPSPFARFAYKFFNGAKCNKYYFVFSCFLWVDAVANVAPKHHCATTPVTIERDGMHATLRALNLNLMKILCKLSLCGPH